ncbi:unnamed protein product [Schistocephalus solidus]|uniref:Alpha-galactosidase n=1 Tax=Schistocephalus solidus TaxID=70667 RepID=A0A183THM6_SCHSO|nr:unnamed protein product [Schistocephalus solidus]
MKNLSDFVHSLGLKFGIYLDFGTKTCEGYPGSMDFLEIDAQTMADWDVDYIKMDGCYSDASVQALGYHAFITISYCVPRFVPLFSNILSLFKGMKNLSDFVHSLGLKFGIYLDFGTKTCEGYPGSMNFLEIDAQTMADWDVDYIKMDGCYSDASVQALGYHAFSRFLNGTGRPIVFSCSYPAYEPWKEPAFPFNWTMLQEDCNLWRMLDDVQDSWASVLGIIGAYEKYHITLALNAGPGHWNDPDMLLLGNYGLSSDQQRVQMGMWVMFAAPLLISTDLGAISDESKQLLQSDLLLQINQDPLGLQALFHYTIGGIKIWTRRLSNNGVAIAFLNPSDSSGGPVRIVVALKQLEVFETDPPFCLTDAFSGKIFAIVDLDTPFEVRINPSGIILLIVQSLN